MEAGEPDHCVTRLKLQMNRGIVSEGAFPAQFVEGVRLFNRREFFECHDVLEELWTETPGDERGFYQGLIHAAVALFHFEGGNLGGARKMYSSTVRYLQPFLPEFMGLDLRRFVDDLASCFRELLDAGDVYPAGAVLPEQRIPMLRLRESLNGH